jgi:molybdate transport system ATP-binding protein
MTMLAVDVEKRLGDFSIVARFETAAGVTAMFGPSGAGKSTLANMIAGLVAPDRGRITLADDVLFDSERRINVPAHRRRIGYVFQEGRLFPHLTIAANLDYGRRMSRLAPDPAERQRIIALLDIDDLLERRPGKLSGGERQRVAIARALIKDARVLVLDEATSSLDSESEHLIQSALWTLVQGRTVIAIAHRLSTIAGMDRVVYLDNGRILEDGPHRVLLANNGPYSRLWNRQMGGFIDAA